MILARAHNGAWMVDLAKIPPSALGLLKSTKKSLLKILKTDDQLFKSNQVHFLLMIQELREAGRHLKVIYFFEELPLPVVGKVVSKDSATLEGYNLVSHQ